MKICSKCGAENKDIKFQCVNCFESLTSAKNVHDAAYYEECRAQLVNLYKAKRKKQIIMIVAYLFVCVALLIGGFVKSNVVSDSFAAQNQGLFFFAILIIGYGLFYLIKPMLCFKLEHFLSVDNIDDVNPSDLYVFDRTVKAYLSLGFAPIMLIILIIS